MVIIHWMKSSSCRGACAGHPTSSLRRSDWMAGTSPAMTGKILRSDVTRSARPSRSWRTSAHSPASIFCPSACTRVTLKRPSAQTTVTLSASTATTSPILPAMPFGIVRRHRRRVENLQLRAVDRGPRAGRGIAAADQPIDLLPRLAPIDAGIVRRRTGLHKSPSTRPA